MRYPVIVTTLLLTACALPVGAASEDNADKPATGGKKIYRTVDESGNVIFSDQKTPDADEVELRESNTLPAEALETEYRIRFGAGDGEPERTETFTPYRTLAVTSPANEEAIRANNGNITISVSVEPAPLANHRVQVLMDGAVLQDIQGPTSISLENVDRGAHTAQLRVTHRETGRTLQQGPSSTFYVLRASRLN